LTQDGLLDRPTNNGTPAASRYEGAAPMSRDPLVIVIVILILLYLLGYFALPAAGNLIHLLLVVILIVVVIRLLQGRRL
jgi:hypothetical protein